MSELCPKRVDIPSSLPQALEVFFSDHEHRGRFFNPWAEFNRPGLGDVLKWQLTPNPDRAIKRSPPVIDYVSTEPDMRWGPQDSQVTWLGHASVLLKMGGRRTVIDPIFGHMMGGMIRRRCPSPRDIETVGKVDVIAITHGHFDHLDKGTVAGLVEANPDVILCVPRGMAAILPRQCRQVVEFDWWQELTLEDVTYSFVPAQHWHRRGLFDLNRVLWGGWVITGEHRFYHSGDTGFFPGFEAIGSVFPGIDVAVLPLGAYEPAWFMGPQHMRPADSVRAFELLGARNFLGMHWGTFDLSDEPLDGGIDEARLAFKSIDAECNRFFALQPGGTLSLSGEVISADHLYQSEAHAGA